MPTKRVKSGKRRAFVVAIVLVAIVGAAPSRAAAQKSLVLAKPDAEYGNPFSTITGVRELRDGRVLVSDGRDKTLQIIRFGGAATKVGREGSGPGEYLIPTRIVALPGDSAAVYDAGNARYLTVHPDGKSGKDFKLEVPGGASPQGLGLTVRAAPRGVDARGNIYYEGPAFALNAAGDLAPSDSAPIIRFDRAALRADTIAYTHLPEGNGSITASGGGIQVLRGIANPLVPRDDWAVLPDGRVAIVRPGDYHIDFYASRSARTAGPPVTYEKIAVDAAVKRMVEEERLRALRNSVTVTGGRGGPPSNTPGRGDPGRPTPPPLTTWPAVVPPFLAGAAVARPMGAASQVWVLRTQRPGHDAPLYDVFDGTGRLIGHVTLPPRTQLIGFGQGTVYLVRSDDDDLQYLQRDRLTNF